MQRRKFIKTTLAGLPIILSTAALTSCSKEDNTTLNGKSVLIIGAGISGLAAAKKLKSKGFDVTVLEAQDKVGGRLRTNRSLGVPFDEGASWIHGINGNPLTSLARQADANTFFTDDNDWLTYDIGGVPVSDAVYATAESKYYNILDTLVNHGTPTDSFETIFNNLYPQYANNRLWKFILSTYLTFDTGDLDKLSSLLYDAGKIYSGGERIMTDGYDKIPLYLAQDLNIRLNERVSKIDYTQEKIKVYSSSGLFEADYAIVSVPLGVLKNNSIEFLPALPQTKQMAIDKLGMNCVNKFLLTWNTQFWDDVQYIAYTPEERDKFNFFLNVKKFHPDVNALMTFAYADYARLTETLDDNQVIDAIMSHLKDIYGNAIPNPTNLLRTKWGTNINSFGAYSYTAVGTEMHHFNDLAESITNKLFFAGEHTHIDYFSTAHGAYLSGTREADKIIAL